MTSPATTTTTTTIKSTSSGTAILVRAQTSNRIILALLVFFCPITMSKV
jgi:hypothetical protein